MGAYVQKNIFGARSKKQRKKRSGGWGAERAPNFIQVGKKKGKPGGEKVDEGRSQTVPS